MYTGEGKTGRAVQNWIVYGSGLRSVYTPRYREYVGLDVLVLDLFGEEKYLMVQSP